MASIRRTLSPAYLHDRSSSLLQNGSAAAVTPLSLDSPPHKPSLNPRFLVGIRRFLAGFLPEKNLRRVQQSKSWRKPFYRCLIFFFLGFLLGVLPFGNIVDVRSNDFSFEVRPEAVHIQAENIIRAEELVSKPEKDDDDDDVKVRVKFDKAVAKFDYEKPRKLLIVVTPTYNRALQAYYLNRLGHVLKLVNPPVLWIVVEMNAQSSETAVILRNIGVMYRHLVCKRNLTDIKDRGVHQRNTALDHIQLHRLDGIVYFADDDNIYSLELFERIRDISRFGTWPVGMLAQNKNKAILEGPVCNGTQVIGWYTNEKSKRLRRFHVDMSGFAFNSTILWDPKRWKCPFRTPVRQLDTVKEGFQETTFIEQVVAEESQMEGVPEGCGKIMNWHLHLDARGVVYPRGWLLQKNLDAVHSID